MYEKISAQTVPMFLATMRSSMALVTLLITFDVTTARELLLHGGGNHATVHNDLSFPVGIWGTGDPEWDPTTQSPPSVALQSCVGVQP